jgi:hypothetical protein
MRQDFLYLALTALLCIRGVVAQTSVKTEFADVIVPSTVTVGPSTVPTALSPENGGVGIDHGSGADSTAGASGADTGAATLTKGGVIGLSIGIGLVVIVISTWHANSPT